MTDYLTVVEVLVIHADQIYVLDKGSLVESGSYGELMAHGGLFAQMAKRQLS